MNWLKIIVIILIVSVVVFIVKTIYAKLKISVLMNSNPESALRTAEKNLETNIFTPEEYECQLTKIANSTGYAGAMLKLADFYIEQNKKFKLADLFISESESGKENKAKSEFWKKRAVKAGDIESITNYYGFSDYDVSSDTYNDMICDLDTSMATSNSENKKAVASYMKGVVYFKMGKVEMAKELFKSLNFPELSIKSSYMLFQCFVKELNINEAEKVLNDLTAKHFEVPATNYLSLYNYYAAKRSSATPDFVAESKYVEKYVRSKDADRETANRIGGSTYYSIAVALQNGSNGFKINMEKSLEAYEKAASFENAEALYYIGKRYWTGESIRNYHKANEFLLRASHKGHEQAKELLELYGVDGILVKPLQAEKISYQFMDGYKLTALSHTIQWLQLYYGFQYKENIIATAFSDTYLETFKSFDQLINGIHQLYADHVAQMLKWSIQLLMFFGIDMYGATDIMEECKDLSLLPRVPGFERRLEKIDNRATQLKMKSTYVQATRRQWSGSGFGTTISSTINATVKASVAAETMNIGSGILHGIGDSIVQAMDNSEIKGMGKNLFENPDTRREFCNALITSCIDIANVVMKMIEKHSTIMLDHLEGIIIFENESLEKIDDRMLNAKIENNLSAQKWDYTYALLVEKLRRQPLDADVFEQIFALTIQRDKSFGGEKFESAIRYAGDFRLDTQNLTAALEKAAVGT